ncbi:MAG: DNA methyltransferase [Candidatus Hodarchaeota archaeon]
MAEKMNNLSGKEWLQNSFSIWRDIDKNSTERKLKHPAMFPTQLTSKLIDIYTKDQGEIILDPFLGSGSTIISAYKKGKKGIGFELSKEYVKLCKKRLSEFNNEEFIKPEIYNKSVFNLLKHVKEESVDLVVTSPPYWDILNQKRSADNKKIRNYSNSKNDLGNINDYEKFLNKLEEVFGLVYKTMKKGKHCIIVVMDIRKKSEFYPFHSDLANRMKNIGFIYDDLIIWDRQKEYNNMRPLGYPWVFRINKVHEYILIFKK